MSAQYLKHPCGIESSRKQHALSTLRAIPRTQRDAREDDLLLSLRTADRDSRFGCAMPAVVHGGLKDIDTAFARAAVTGEADVLGDL